MADVLNPDALETSLNQLDGWAGTVDTGITKTFELEDFAEAMRFVNAVAGVAEEMNHHPDIHVSWNSVRLDIVSHAAGGVTEDCVELAGRIDMLAGGAEDFRSH